MTTDAQAAAKLRLAELRAGFAAKLAARWDELDALLIRGRDGDPRAQAEALFKAHQLAGTAGSYGYDEAGRHAATIERLLGSGESLEPAAWALALAEVVAARAR